MKHIKEYNKWSGKVGSEEEFRTLSQLLQSEIFDDYNIFEIKEYPSDFSFRALGTQRFWIMKTNYDFDGIANKTMVRYLFVSLDGPEVANHVFDSLENMKDRVEEQLDIKYVISLSSFRNCINVQIN